MSQKKLINKVLIQSSINKCLDSTAPEEEYSEKTIKLMTKNEPFSSHPAMKYIFETSIDEKAFWKFTKMLYNALEYSVNSLQGPCGKDLDKQKVTLPGINGNFLIIQIQKKKFSYLTWIKR